MSNFNTDNDKIMIDFSLFPFCFRCVKVKKFTNKLKNADQFFELFKRLFEIDIPALVQFNFNNVTKSTNKHSHAILKDSTEYNLIIEIIKELLKAYKKDNFDQRYFQLFLENNINEYHIWQLGIIGGVRLMGIRRSNVFYVLFIDYHHLIYPDQNYNQNNYDLFDFCPIKNN